MLNDLRAYAAALDAWPDGVQELQHHFSVILPEMLEKLKTAITDELTYNEMWALMEILDLLMYGPVNKETEHEKETRK